jgi:hypothetical protein
VVGPTPNPIDPYSGLAIIGSTTARYNAYTDDFSMSGDYTAVGGAHLFQQLNLDVAEFKARAAACAADLAALADKGSQFVNMVWQTFGTRIKVAVGAAGFLEMSVGEAVGVALSTITLAELAPIFAALALTSAFLYAAYRCYAVSEGAVQ